MGKENGHNLGEGQIYVLEGHNCLIRNNDFQPCLVDTKFFQTFF